MSGDKSCPEDTENFIYDFWPGSQFHCNALRSREERYQEIKWDEQCQDNPEGFDVGALAPIFQNRFRGLKYCGKKTESSYLDLQRPVLTQLSQPNEYRYECPEGFVACNEEFFSQTGGEEYVVCRKQDDSTDADCPITSVQLSVT